MCFHHGFEVARDLDVSIISDPVFFSRPSAIGVRGKPLVNFRLSLCGLVFPTPEPSRGNGGRTPFSAFGNVVVTRNETFTEAIRVLTRRKLTDTAIEGTPRVNMIAPANDEIVALGVVSHVVADTREDRTAEQLAANQ